MPSVENRPGCRKWMQRGCGPSTRPSAARRVGGVGGVGGHRRAPGAGLAGVWGATCGRQGVAVAVARSFLPIVDTGTLQLAPAPLDDPRPSVTPALCCARLPEARGTAKSAFRRNKQEAKTCCPKAPPIRRPVRRIAPIAKPNIHVASGAPAFASTRRDCLIPTDVPRGLIRRAHENPPQFMRDPGLASQPHRTWRLEQERRPGAARPTMLGGCTS